MKNQIEIGIFTDSLIALTRDRNLELIEIKVNKLIERDAT